MISGKTIIMIANVPWHWNWQRQQEWASRFAKDNKVIYISNFGSKNQGPLSIIRKIIKQTKRSSGFQHVLDPDVRKNIQLVTPIFLPVHGITLITRFNAWLINRKLRRLIADDNVLFWVCHPSDTILELLKFFPNAPVVYDIATRFLCQPDAPRRQREYQDALARKANVIFFDAHSSRDDLPKDVHSKAFFIPQGVNETFLRAGHEKSSVAEKLKAIPKPIVGYVGAFHNSVDTHILSELVKKLPQIHLAVIGNYQTIPNELDHPRVHFLGPVNFEELPSYVAGIDVGLIPYRIDAYTQGVFPTKMFEYLAMGVPVVSTDLTEMRRFNEKVVVTRSTEQFIQAVKTALTMPRRVPDQAFLDTHSWAARFTEIQRLLQKYVAA
jgi:glycosyltransferase involved in cell wall biosynthesis